jgi:hypothetical protein
MAPNQNPGVIPPGSNPYGQSYAQWSAAWWRWLWSAPAATNPGLDSTGDFVNYGQSGPVWFLAPNYGFGAVDVRYATIPAGRALFIELAGFFSSFELGDGPTVDDLIAAVSAAADGIQQVVFEVDGVALENVENYRFQSPLFEYTLPEESMFNFFGLPTPPGTYYPGVSDGYYVMLTPLPVGEHTLHIFADLGPVWGTSEVTFHLTTVAGGGSKMRYIY